MANAPPPPTATLESSLLDVEGLGDEAEDAYAVLDELAALARDAGALKRAGYRVLSAVPVGQFLWSPHVEAVATLEK